jgi:hypothetical protein
LETEKRLLPLQSQNKRDEKLKSESFKTWKKREAILEKIKKLKAILSLTKQENLTSPMLVKYTANPGGAAEKFFKRSNM